MVFERIDKKETSLLGISLAFSWQEPWIVVNPTSGYNALKRDLGV